MYYVLQYVQEYKNTEELVAERQSERDTTTDVDVLVMWYVVHLTPVVLQYSTNNIVHSTVWCMVLLSGAWYAGTRVLLATRAKNCPHSTYANCVAAVDCGLVDHWLLLVGGGCVLCAVWYVVPWYVVLASRQQYCGTACVYARTTQRATGTSAPVLSTD
jgi:hypothetical protein